MEFGNGPKKPVVETSKNIKGLLQFVVGKAPLSSGLQIKLSSLRFGRRKMLYGKLPCNPQPLRLRTVKEEDRFIKESSKTSDSWTPSRWSSLSLVRFWTSLLMTDVLRLTCLLPERSSEDSLESLDSSCGTWPENWEEERSSFSNLANWPNPDEIDELKQLKARLSCCKLGRRKRLLLEWMVPWSSLQLRSRPITSLPIVSHVTPSHEQQSLPSFQDSFFWSVIRIFGRRRSWIRMKLLKFVQRWALFLGTR